MAKLELVPTWVSVLLTAFILLTKQAEAAAKPVISGGSGSAATTGTASASKAGGALSTTSGTSYVTTNYRVYTTTNNLYTGSLAYRTYPIFGMTYIYVHSSNANKNVTVNYALANYTDGSSENCTLISNVTGTPDSGVGTSLFTSNVQPYLPLNYTSFDNWNGTLLDTSKRIFWVGNCTIKAFGAGTKGSWAMVPY